MTALAIEAQVAIVGGGLVGMALACALARADLRIALIDPDAGTSSARQPAGWDSRIYAISPTSEAFLRDLGAWPPDPDRLCAVQEMRVFGDRPEGYLRLSAAEAAVARLATIAEQCVLGEALRARVAASAGIEQFTASCLGLESEPHYRRLLLSDGRRVEARLLVAADGAGSWLRAQLDIPVEVRAYGQTAVVANFNCALPHRGVAFQWFRHDGILALLPLPGQRVSMVWSAQEEKARSLLDCAGEELGSRVAEASGGVLGALELMTPAAGFPLRLLQASTLLAPRVALVGDAAHNLHPLAGQGVNLGFADAQRLADVLAHREPGRDPGEHALLRRYERSQKERIVSLTLVTDGLQRLFSADNDVLARLRNGGLWVTQRLSPIKRLLISQALG